MKVANAITVIALALSSTIFAGPRYDAWVKKRQGTVSGANGAVNVTGETTTVTTTTGAAVIDPENGSIAAGENGAAVKVANGPLTVVGKNGNGFVCLASKSSLLVVGQGDNQVAIFCDLNNCTTMTKSQTVSVVPITADAKEFLEANCP